MHYTAVNRAMQFLMWFEVLFREWSQHLKILLSCFLVQKWLQNMLHCN